MRVAATKTQSEIDNEWDRIAAHRSEQIRTGQDISYKHILLPTVLALAATLDRASVLDIGCGCGFLTEQIAPSSSYVFGIDPSNRSVELAREHCKNLPNTGFSTATIERYSETLDRQFSLAIANMSLTAMLELPIAIKAIAKSLQIGGNLIFTIPHPCFWPTYWKYSDDWYEYRKKLIVEAPFVISLDKSEDFITTHVHRPLEMYTDCFSRAGLAVIELHEPMPTHEIESMYPSKWMFPRFLAGVCQLVGNRTEQG